MAINPTNPVIVQGDGKVLLETRHPQFDKARDFLARFAELESSPELLHTYRITALSLWNAASVGMSRDEIVNTLRGLSKFDVPGAVLEMIEDTIQRYGLVQLRPHATEPRKWIRVQFDTLFVQKMVLGTATGKEMLRTDGRRDFVIDAGM